MPAGNMWFKEMANKRFDLKFLLKFTIVLRDLGLFWKVPLLWATFRYDGLLPSYVNITNGKTADNKGAYDVPLIKQSVIVADRFYNDFSLLNVWDSKEVFFFKNRKKKARIPMDTLSFYCPKII